VTSPGQIVLKIPISKKPEQNRLAVWLKHKALSSNHSPAFLQEKKKRMSRRLWLALARHWVHYQHGKKK
jgi:hypothetical protein